MLDKDYKFYLAFENSNCKEYITEKLFDNSLTRNILPIVMGARPKDYEKYAPKHSYIHVDEFASPMDLAKYLNKLDKDDELYNSYFRWKGTGEFKAIYKFYFCDLCRMLHDKEAISNERIYPDFNKWWHEDGICTSGSWRYPDATNDSPNK